MRSRTRATQLDLSNVGDDLRNFILEYRNGSRDIKQLVSNESLRTREHISTSSKETFQALGGIQKTLTSLTLESDVQIYRAKRERLLQSLKFPGSNERRNQVSEAYEKTFKWIYMGDDGPSQEDPMLSDLEDVDLADPSEANWDLFSNWLSSTAGIYWISGKPGSGKTTLVKYVLDHPRTATYLDMWSPGTLKISHFFWRPGNEMQQSIKGLLCSLLYQLLDNSAAATVHVFQYMQGRGSDAKDAHTDWSIPELREILLQTLSSYEHPICIFIDGLDEILPADGSLKLLELVEQFPRCRNTKLCLASRPEPILQGRLSVYPHLRLQDLTRADLDRYARDHIKQTGVTDDENTSSSSRDFDAAWHPIESIVDKAEGVFLWLVLAVQSINKGFIYGDTPSMIQQRIDNLPGDLMRLYKDMWNRACEDSPKAYRQTAGLYLRLILLDAEPFEPNRFPLLSTLQLMLASTSVADQLLDAIENPLNLIPQERLLKECRNLEKQVELYCFGLVEFIQSPSENGVVGWYGSQYDRVWSCYGQRHPEFIHRTARDFLLDTLEGREILSHDVSSEPSLFIRWFKAHLATSQLYVDTLSENYPRNVVNNVETYTRILENKYDELGPCDRNWIQAVFYLERLCSSGQMLRGAYYDNGYGRFCGGIEFLKVAASICGHESIWPVAKMRKLSTETISEILLNLCDRDRRSSRSLEQWHSSNAEHGISALLREGADPNWKGTMFMQQSSLHGSYSQTRTPFTAYLEKAFQMICDITTIEQYHIAQVLGNLHEFLSHSAQLGDVLNLCFLHEHSDDVCMFSYTPGRVEYYCGDRSPGCVRDPVVISFSAHTILRELLACIGKEFEHPRRRTETRYKEIMSLIAGIQKELDNWSKGEEYRVVGKFVRRGNGAPIWYLPPKDFPAQLSNELMKELVELVKIEDCSRAGKITSQFLHQTSWGVPAKGLEKAWTAHVKGLDEIWESLAELGVLSRVECEVHDMRFWVDRFQDQISADGGFADGIEVAQSYIGSLNI